MDIVSSFLKQWTTRQKEIPSSIRAIHQKFQTQEGRPELSELLDCMKNSVTSFSSTFVILDALDECEMNQLSKLLGVIRHLSSMPVKIFATSRPHLRDVLDFFQAARTIQIKADILDLKNYLTIQVEERMSHSRKLRSKVVDKLSTEADGV
jgi:hypothetical protein